MRRPGAARLVAARLVVACLVAAGLVAVCGLVATTPLAAQATGSGEAPAGRTGQSGMPLPRFVSLKSDRINVRAGPGEDHRIEWIFAKAGLPVEIVAEYDNWRRIRDSEGAEGWVFHSLLSGRRTALIAPWSDRKTIDMYRDPDDDDVAARLEPGVLVNVEQCDGKWCRVAVSDVAGWLRQDQLWGVYPKEVVK